MRNCVGVVVGKKMTLRYSQNSSAISARHCPWWYSPYASTALPVVVQHTMSVMVTLEQISPTVLIK